MSPEVSVLGLIGAILAIVVFAWNWSRGFRADWKDDIRHISSALDEIVRAEKKTAELHARHDEKILMLIDRLTKLEASKRRRDDD